MQSSRDLNSRADRLCSVIESHADDLRSAVVGRRFAADGVRFRLWKADRNSLYQLDDRGDVWFLKMPRSGNPAAVEREVLGADVMRAAVADFSDYRLPEAIRTSLRHAYLLVTKTPGRTLNRCLFPTVCLPWRRGDEPLRHAFAQLGSVVARFHRSPIETDLLTTRSAAKGLRKSLEKTVRSDQTLKSIERYADEAGPAPQADCIAHGNLHLQNVLIAQRRLSVIDFEECGHGSRYDDLSMFLTQLACTGLAVHVMPRRLATLREAFLDSYSEETAVDLDILNRAIATRVCQYYATRFCGTQARPTALGVPVPRSRARRLVENHLDAV